MSARHEARLDPGRVYRTSHLARWSANPTRLARRLEDEGKLEKLGHGLFYAPVESRFGRVPPTDQALLDAFFDGSPWTVTGPPKWNALGLGSTQLFAKPLVYNTKRSGETRIGGRTFQLRRVAFPTEPTSEWFVIDLLRNAASVGLDRAELATRLRVALEAGRYSVSTLADMATRFGRRSEQALVREVTAGLTW